MSRLRAIATRLGLGREQDPEDRSTTGDLAAAGSAAPERYGAADEAGDDPTTPDAASLTEFEAHEARLREGGPPTASDAAPAPNAPPDPQGER
jgi:hypothetical protein